MNRADRYVSGMNLKPGEAAYSYKAVGDDQIGLSGDWLIEKEQITSRSNKSELTLNFLASQVYLVMDSNSEKEVTVLLDGQPLPSKYYTDDMNASGQVKVKGPRKYDIINLKKEYGRHLLTLIVPEDVSLFAFTFGDESNM